VAIDKPAGMVVHAGAGVRAGTLVNALLHASARSRPRAARCDPASCIAWTANTSGVLLVAKNDAAHRNLAGSFASRA